MRERGMGKGWGRRRGEGKRGRMRERGVKGRERKGEGEGRARKKLIILQQSLNYQFSPSLLLMSGSFAARYAILYLLGNDAIGTITAMEIIFRRGWGPPSMPAPPHQSTPFPSRPHKSQSDHQFPVWPNVNISHNYAGFQTGILAT